MAASDHSDQPLVGLQQLAPDVDDAYRTWTSVREFGATGDGSTDDTEAIQRAVEAAGEGGTVYFPLGTYRISAPLRGLPQQTFRGSGSNSGVSARFLRGVQIVASHAGAVLQLAPCSHVRELRLMGPGDTVSGSVGISARDSSAVVLDEVTIWHTELGIDLSKCWYAHINHCSLWNNQTAMRVEYCYNVSLHNIRISGLLADGSSNGTGIEMVDRSLLSLHGGAIEQYRTGISLGSAMQLSMFGVYMETRTVGSHGVLASGDGPQVLATGCQVYVNNHQAWIDLSGARGGGLSANANKFKGGQAGQPTLAYRWKASASAPRVQIGGDSWHDVLRHPDVRHHERPLPPGSLVEAPEGAPGASQPVLASTMNRAGLGQAWVSTGSGWRRPQLGDDEAHVGAQFFDTRLGHAIWWTGSDWVDAQGQPVDGNAWKMATRVQTGVNPLLRTSRDGLARLAASLRSRLRR
ncbi:glycosyl hydrolase family 28-related protein [Luteococcus sp. OSA5]|uniref:glycosyl hydrolase family 28-related protein n=1 Tax=Luteococcus sp. OSA5 TaxID=3401630 RepID=UPI003B43737A